MNFRRTPAPLLFVLACALALCSRAENWPNWRGPTFNGASSETGLPATFSKAHNVKWVAEMPGPSAATPIIWDDRVFLSSTDSKTRTLQAMCVDRKTGKTLWQEEASVGFGQDNRSTYSSPSPVTDGALVYFFYGNGELAAFDLNGKKAWARNIQKDFGQFAFLWTFSTSPALHDGKLYMQVLQRDVAVNGRGRTDGPNDSYILALDPKSGKELWKQVRPADAREESLEAFTTPIPFKHGDRNELLVAGGDCITGHDAATGKELWRWGTWNPNKITHWRLVASPVAGGGVVLACGPKGAPVFAVKAGQSGTLDDSGLAWTSSDRDVSTDVSTPLFYRNRYYILNSDKKILSCVEPTSGKVLWKGELESRAKLEASPTGADDKIYMMNHRGEVFIVEAADEFKLLHVAGMGDDADNNLRASVAVSGGNLFVRTGSKLYCVGK